MRYLLDTCSILYVGGGLPGLSAAAEAELTDPDAEVFVSAISAGELACLYQGDRVQLGKHWRRWWQEALTVNGWVCLSVTEQIIVEAYSLPEPVHRDPADRILMATARIEKMTLVTSDRKILDYPHVESLG